MRYHLVDHPTWSTAYDVISDDDAYIGAVVSNGDGWWTIQPGDADATGFMFVRRRDAAKALEAAARPASESAGQGSGEEPLARPVPAGAGGMGKGDGREG